MRENGTRSSGPLRGPRMTSQCYSVSGRASSGSMIGMPSRIG